MKELNLVKSKEMIKVLGMGELKSSIKIFAHKFSAKAKSEIEAKGGEAVLI